MKKMNKMLIPLVIILFIALILYGAISFDIWRWHTFQDLTNSDISYWKWHLLFGGHK
jgi:hypothetical protein